MKHKVKPIRPTRELNENKKLSDSREQDTLTPPFVDPTLQSPASTDPLLQTEPLAVMQRAHNTLFQQMLARLPVPLQQTATRFFEQVEDPYPERMDVKREAEKPTIIQWGWLPALTLACALGVFSIAYGFAAARDGQPGLEVAFIVGLLLIFVPTMVRQLSPDTPRHERIGTMCVIGLCLYFVKIMASPTYFSLYDEFLHWRTADDIATTRHLFAPNSLLPVSPYYPGLEIVTNALSMLSGLNSFYSGLLVIGVARIIMVLALFLLTEQMMNSSRIASIATLVYMSNPHFLLFDSQYAYESLALPLVFCILFMTSLHQVISLDPKRLELVSPIPIFASASYKQLRRDLFWITCTTCIVIGAVAFTHHVTDLFLDGILILWAIIYGFQRGRGQAPPPGLYSPPLVQITLIGIGITIVSVIRIGNPVVTYLGLFFQITLNELRHIIVGASSARPLFQNYTGTPTPLWERLLTVTSQGLVMLGLPVGLLCLWKRYRSNALTYTFIIMALGYPLAQVFRFTTSGSELADRSAAFLFMPISSVLAILVIQCWPVRHLKRIHLTTLTILLSVIFLGGSITGLGPALALLPGQYMVSADPRSIEPEGIEAAIWTDAHLGTGNRVESDRINQILMGTYGHQRVVTSIQDGIDDTPLFLSLQFNADAAYPLKVGSIGYIVVDMRETRYLPLLGYYYANYEFDAFKHKKPLNPPVLTKFDTVQGVNKIFSSGDIVIYDMKGVLNATT